MTSKKEDIPTNVCFFMLVSFYLQTIPWYVNNTVRPVQGAGLALHLPRQTLQLVNELEGLFQTFFLRS